MSLPNNTAKRPNPVRRTNRKDFMNESHLTQEIIDTPTNGTRETNGLYSQAAKHPLIAGGVILVGAGLAYAAARAIAKPDESAKVAGDVHIETSIAIDKSPEELYRFWRDFRNLPLFMKNLESVTELDRFNSHWVAKVGSARVEWDAEVYN